MQKIKLVVTGDLERAALHTALAAHFPSQRNGKDIEWCRPRQTYGVTSGPPQPPPGRVWDTGWDPERPVAERRETRMEKLARAAIVEVEYADQTLVVVVDDAEIGNMANNAAHVVDGFCVAVQNVVNRRYEDPADRSRLRERLREQLSFHLLMPMVEAYFFVGRRPLDLLGIPRSVVPALASRDVEAFETTDPEWLPTCAEENLRRNTTDPWWRHERHPKHYLDALRDRSRLGVYSETSPEAQQALHGVEWGTGASDGLRFVRALFGDLAAWFDVDNPLGAGETAGETQPERATRPDQRVLRNR